MILNKVRRLTPLLALTILSPNAAAAPRVDTPLKLRLPLACTIGQTCVVQNYVDDDPSPAAHDFLCRGRTYNGHNGTDFRISSIAAEQRGVAVLAAAAGRVLRARDGVPDVSVRIRGAAAVSGEECGNGLVIDDGHGWETQYCHLARGSLRVHPGRRVKAGQTLGLVGLSGDTEFPHVHLTVRKDRRVIDPFAYGAAPGSCGGGVSLWEDRIPYQSGEVLTNGFATHVVSLEQIEETGSDQPPRPSRAAPALVAFVLSVGLEKGDVQRIRIISPDASVLVEGEAAPLDHDKAQQMWLLGRKRPPGGWMPGVYQAEFSVRRDGIGVIERTFRITL